VTDKWHFHKAKFTYADTARQYLEAETTRSADNIIEFLANDSNQAICVHLFSSLEFIQICMPYLCEGGYAVFICVC